MGLDISHDAFHGAYSSFNRFRQFVLESIGGSYPPHKDKTLDDEYWYWDIEPLPLESYEGLEVFFGHSDCDGEISPNMCKKIAEEFESIRPLMIEYEKRVEATGHLKRNGGYMNVVDTFINGCKLAYENNEYLEFM